jgi:hypothetical protein
MACRFVLKTGRGCKRFVHSPAALLQSVVSVRLSTHTNHRLTLLSCQIAEGNPDVSKVGAFGVGAYTMFSICEEPLIISGNSCCSFIWKGDALWCKTAPLTDQKQQHQPWTSFVLPSRDPYPLPDLIEFGEFLTASLTFTASLKHVCVYVNGVERLSITKTAVQEPRLIATPKSSSWFSNQGAAVTTTPKGTFSLMSNSRSTNSSTTSYLTSSLKTKIAGEQRQVDEQSSIYESMHRLTVVLDGAVATMDARYVSAMAKCSIGTDMARRMQRVTKKDPPSTLQVQLFLNATFIHKKPQNAAEQITQSFSPKPGSGRIFIGFRTSQTTGLAAHVAAPFIPTVEREAMDLQDLTLRVFNLELLELAGILLRLTLEHTMYTVIDVAWTANAGERQALEQQLMREQKQKGGSKNLEKDVAASMAERKEDVEDSGESDRSTSLMGFARFMAR